MIWRPTAVTAFTQSLYCILHSTCVALVRHRSVSSCCSCAYSVGVHSRNLWDGSNTYYLSHVSGDPIPNADCGCRGWSSLAKTIFFSLSVYFFFVSSIYWVGIIPLQISKCIHMCEGLFCPDSFLAYHFNRTTYCSDGCNELVLDDSTSRPSLTETQCALVT